MIEHAEVSLHHFVVGRFSPSANICYFFWIDSASMLINDKADKNNLLTKEMTLFRINNEFVFREPI